MDKNINKDENNLKSYPRWFGVEGARTVIISDNYSYCKTKALEKHRRVEGFESKDSAIEYYNKTNKRITISSIKKDSSKKKKLYLKHKICPSCKREFAGEIKDKLCQECSNKKTCLVCEKKFIGKGELCQSCKTKAEQQNLSTREIIARKKLYSNEDVFKKIKYNKTEKKDKFDLDYRIKFGKYKGRKLIDVYETAPEYINWVEKELKDKEELQTQIKLLKKYIKK